MGRQSARAHLFKRVDFEDLEAKHVEQPDKRSVIEGRCGARSRIVGAVRRIILVDAAGRRRSRARLLGGLFGGMDLCTDGRGSLVEAAADMVEDCDVDRLT